MSHNQLYPLTLPQQTFYLDYLLHQNDSKYNMGAPMILNGDLDIDLFRKAYDYVIQKYDTLRQRFVTRDGELFQMFLPGYQCNIEYRDFRDRENPLEDAMQFLVEENGKPFFFEKTHLYLEMIIQTGDKQFIWFTRFHHFSNDAYGRSVINQSISDTYNSLLSNGSFPEIKAYSYLDFLEDDLIYRDSEIFKNSSEYWCNKLSPLPEPFDFTSKKQGLKEMSLHNERITLNLHRMCYAAMLKIADQAGVSPFQAILGILYTTLSKIYNKSDMVIGMPVLNRSNHKFRNTPGLFMNMIPLRLKLTDSCTFTDILNTVKAEVKESYRHQRLPLSEIYKHFRNHPEFKNELFDVTIVYRKMDFSQKLGDVKLQTVTLDTQIRNESLGLEIDEYDDEDNVNLFFNYNPLVLSELEVIQFARCFETVLFELIYFPEKSIAEVKFLSEFELHKLTRIFNINGEVKQTKKTIIDQFDECVRDYSGKPAVINNQESLSYSELGKKADQIAHYLIEQHQVCKGDIICMATERSIEAIVAMIGIMKTGAIYLPVDSHHPRERIEYILNNSGAKVLITDNPEFNRLTDKVILLDSIVQSVESRESEKVRKYEGEISSSHLLTLSPSLSPKDLAYIIYTSGSTGMPKGVMIEHGSFMNMFVNMVGKFGVTETDRVLQFASLGFDAAVFEIFQALLTGAALVIAEKEIIQNPTSFIRYMDDKKVTVATIPPAYLSALDKPEFPHLHTLITAGEKAIPSDVNHYKRFKRFINAYGPTEASVCASYYIAEKDKDYEEYIPIGKTVPGSSLYILNDNFEHLPVGFAGELCISGPNLARGYLNNEELTIQKFVPDPYNPELRMYRTGDRARLMPDGNIEFLGRTDDQVKIRGNRIELGEIESRLQDYPLIKEVVVLDVERNNNKDIAAFIISDPASAGIEINELRKFILDFLPEYMVPQYFHFIDKIPLTQNGKINKNDLRKIVSVNSITGSENSSAPTETEQKLIPLVERVLNYSPVGVTDNFFELGGDSLKIARLITVIKKELRLEIRFKTIFDKPTVRGVASELASSETDNYHEIKVSRIKDHYPLSHSQKRLWILSQDEENSSAYNMPVPLLLEGDLNTEYLKKAVHAIVDRHEALRTIFINIEGTPYQKIVSCQDDVAIEHDFSHNPGAEEITKDFINKEVMTPFVLSEEIPVRAHLVKIKKEKFVFLLLIHHIAGDGVSVGIILNELSFLYNSKKSENENVRECECECEISSSPLLTLSPSHEHLPPLSPLKPLRIQYKDYCFHEQELLSGDKYTKEKEYWLNILQHPLPVLNLPTDRMRPPVKTYTGKYLHGKLDESLTKSLIELGKANNVSPFMVLLASVNILLYKYTSQEDIIIGSPIAGRNHQDFEDQVGVYINTIALRNNINSGKSFIDFLEDVKTKSSEAFSNCNYPFDRLIQDLNLDRDTSRAPIFDILIQYQNQDVTTLNLNGVKSSFYMVDFTANKFDLTFTFTGAEGTGQRAESTEQIPQPYEMAFSIGYNTDLFNTDRIERAGKHLINILAGAIENPNVFIRDIEVLDSEEKLRLLELADGKSLELDDKTVIDLFAEQVKRNPDNIALVFNEKELSYKQLNQRANAVANEILKNASISPDDIVAIMSPPSELTVIGILGILKSGAAYLPISPDLPAERIKFMLRNSGSKLILAYNSLMEKADEIVSDLNAEGVHDFTTTRLHETLSGIGTPKGFEKAPFGRPDTQSVPLIRVLDISNINNPSYKVPVIDFLPSSLAYVIYTSGSTGMPKGVMIEHRSLFSLIRSLTKMIYSNYHQPENELLMASFMFDVSVRQLFAVLCNGHSLHVLNEESKHAVDEIIDYVVSKRIKMMSLTPSLFSVMLEAGFGEISKPDLKEIFIGAEALSYKSIERFLSSGNNDEINIYNFYGPTECCVESTTYKIRQSAEGMGQSEDSSALRSPLPAPCPLPSGIVPIGKPIENEQVYILDKDLKLCPIGVPGEIYIAGIGLARGYLNDEGKTKERFFEGLHGSRVYKTGDLGKLGADGNIDFLGRIDDQVKVRGFRIELQEIEKHLREFNGINSCTVILYKNKEENEIAAYFTSTVKPDISEIRNYLGLFLPSYMIPRYFMQVEYIPLTASRKVDKKLLPDPCSSEVHANQFNEPRTDIGERLIDIWKELLNINEIRVNDDFFKLGGHSLLVMRLTLQIQKNFNITVKIWDIFQHSTIVALAEFLKDKLHDSTTSRLHGSLVQCPIAGIEKLDVYPLSHAQRRLWILSKIEKHDSLYNIPAILQLKGDLNIEALEKSFNALIRRHESFRTSFIEIDEQPFQKIEQDINFKIDFIDYSNGLENDDDLEKIISGNSSAIFDLSFAPLLKVRLVKKSVKDHLLLVNMHHIISDGWSFGIMFKELGIFYNAFLNGQDFPLQPLRIQYKDFTSWQNNTLEEHSLEEVKNYWHKKLSAPRLQTGFPHDFRRPGKYTNDGNLIIHSLDSDLSKSLYDFSNSNRVSLFMIMVAAVNVLISKYTVEEDIVVGTPVAGRQHEDLKDQIGFYVNTLALRSEVNPDSSFARLLKDVKVTITEAMDNQAYPFDKLIDELGVERQINRNPLFDIMVAWMVNNKHALQDSFHGIEIKNIDLNLNKSKFDLSFIFEEDNSLIRFAVEYNTSLYKRDTIEEISANFVKLLGTVVENPVTKIKELVILPTFQQGEGVECENVRKCEGEIPPSHPLTLPSSHGGALGIKIANIWKELLNVDVVSGNDNFFDTGGNSLTAIRFASRIHKALNIELNVSEIFQHPTFSSLTEIIRSKNPALFSPINKIEEMEYYPLSHSQHRLWFLSKLEDQQTLYNLPAVIQFFGEVNLEAMERSFNGLIQRHESLRTSFVEIDGQPYQRILNKADFKVDYADYSDRVYNETLLNKLAGENLSKVFDLSVAPLLQVRLVKTSDKSYLLLLNMPHIISDGWSLEVMLKELELFYTAFRDVACNVSNLVQSSPLLPLRIQYKDYSAWQNRLLNDDSLNNIKQYWLKKLSLPRQLLELPLDFNRPEKYTIEGNLSAYKIDIDITSKLRAICTGHNASLYMTLLSAVNILLHKYASSEDIILGTPVAGRQHSDLENQLGLFVNTVVLRNQVNPETTFIELLNNVKTTLSEALDNQAYPFEKIVEELDVERIINRNPLFDVMVSWMINTDASTKKSFSNIYMQGINLPGNKSMFDLSIIFEENENEVGFALEYNTALFKHDTIERISEHFKELLVQIVKNPKEKIRNLQVIPCKEREKLLEFNNTDLQVSINNVIHEFEKQAEICNDLLAVITDEKSITYGELNILSNRCANYLIETFSPAKNDIISVVVDDPILATISLLGIIKSGAAYLPLMSDNPPERISYILRDSNSIAVLTNIDLSHVDLPCPLINLKETVKSNDSNPQIIFDDDSLAYVIYTSGSTGSPKGVLIEHKSLQNLIFSLRMRIYSAYDKPLNELMITSFGFDVSVKQIFATLCSGNSLHILDKERRVDPREIVRYIVEKKINVADLTSSLFAAMLEEGFSEIDKPELKELFLGSEALPYRYVKAFLGHENNKGLNVYNFYGPTECCVESSYYKFDNNDPANAGHYPDIAPIGKPIINTGVYILDKYLNLCPIGVPGEICISGFGLARGYLNDPAKSSMSFIDLAILNGARIYKTGDLGKMRVDGNIEFLGRIDEQVKVRGYRIELQEIEKHLRNHEEIIDAVVVLHKKELAAYFTSGVNPEVSRVETLHATSLSKIKSYLGQLLPNYMIPAYIIRIEKIPRSVNGKVNKKGLPDPVLNISTSTDFENPANAVEKELLGFWQDVLGIENISIHDNFFDAGGNSFLLVKLHKRISAKYPDVFKLTDLFSKSNIAGQAEYITHRKSESENVRKCEGEGEISSSHLPVFSSSLLKCHDIAVVGISATIGDSVTTDHFWEKLRLGVDFIGTIPEDRIADVAAWCEKNNMDPTALKFREGCFVRDIDKFDYGFFKLSPGEASIIDPGQRLFMQTAYHALEDAGYAGKKLWGSRTGVFIGGGKTVAEYSRFIEMADIQDSNLLLSAQTPSIMAGRLSYLLNLKGPALLVDTACSSSLVAVHLACRSIRDGQIDSAIVGGVNLNLLPVDTGTRTEIDSSDGRAHSFDDSANGTGGGEGIIALVLKPLDKAKEDRDNVYAVIKGSFINQDGNSIGLAAPDSDAQADVIEKAWIDAGIDPETVSFIETHGTGTKLGDPIEIEGITKAFKRYTDQNHICAIGAVKANIGHLDSAAGLAGFLKAVLSLKYKELTPLTHYKNPNRNINFEESAAYINKNLTVWNHNDHPLRCGVSSFGLSGTNCHVILEEAPFRENSPGKKDHKYLFTLSARNHDVLLEYIDQIRHHLYKHPEESEIDICYSLSSGRAHHSYRLAVLFETKNELISKLSAVFDNGLHSVAEKHIYASHLSISVPGKYGISDNTTTENKIRKISNDINSILKTDPTNSDNIMLITKAYIKGADIAWEDFYKNENPQKIALPGYPFEKNRCWVKLKEDDTTSRLHDFTNAANHESGSIVSIATEYGRKFDNIFLNTCIIDTPATAIYSTLYDEKTWWLLREHRIMGHPALVGAAYLQIAYEAFKNHLDTRRGDPMWSPLFIEDFYLLQPITLYDEKPLDVLTTITKYDSSNIGLEVYSKSNNNDWQTYSRLKIQTDKTNKKAGKNPEYLDIDEIKSRMTDSIEVNKIEHNGEDKNFISVSEKWNCLNKIHRNNEEFLGELSIPEDDQVMVANFTFYPPLVDAAVSFGLNESGYLPYSYGNVELKGPVSGSIYSYIQKKSSGSKETSSFNITITDTKGKVLAVFTDFLLKKVQSPKQNRFFHELIWKPQPLSEESENVRKYEGGISSSLPLTLSSSHGDAGTILLYTDESHLLPQFENLTCVNLRDPEYAGFSSIFENPTNVPDKIIYLLPDCNIEEIKDNLALEQSLNRSLYLAFKFTKYLALNISSSIDILFVGKNVSEVTGNELYLNSLHMSVSGLGHVLQLESSNFRCRFLDIDNQSTGLEILRELNNGFTESYYYRALRNSKRFIRELKIANSTEKQNTNISFKENSVYLITGGTGGIGLELAGFLAKQALVKDNVKIKLALLNRSEFPERSRWDKILKDRNDAKLCRKIEKLLEIEEDSAGLYLFSTDVADYYELKDTITTINNDYGEIRGLIHCAGIPGEGFIFGKTAETFRKVIEPKVQGTIYLSKLLEKEKLDFFVMASSLTGIMPAPGQSDYTAANIFLDAFASELTRKGINAVSVDFTAWKETGMAYDFNVVGDGIFKSVTTQNALLAFGEILQRKTSSVLLGESDFSLIGSAELPFFLNTDLLVPKTSTRTVEQTISGKNTTVVLKGREKGNRRRKIEEGIMEMGDYSEMETSVAEVWADVLGYEELNVFDNYYDLGGDSIHAIKINSMLKQKLSVELTIADLFNHLTIAELAEFLELKKESETGKKSESEISSEIIPVDKREYYPASSAQRRLFFIDRASTDKFSNHMPEVWHVKGDLNLEQFTKAFIKLIERQESLRTSFALIEEKPVQIINKIAAFSIPVKEMNEDEAKLYIRSFVKPFDLSVAPLISVEIIRLSSDDHLVLFDGHHIILDGYSMEILISELMNFYRGIEPEPLDIQYKDFSQWQNNHYNSNKAVLTKSYWLKQFDGEIPALNLPRRHPVSNDSPDDAGSCLFSLGKDLTAEVKESAASLGISTFMCLLAAVKILLGKFAGQEDVTIGVASIGRNRPELSLLIGMFVNYLPVRTRFNKDMTPAQYLQTVKQATVNAFANNDFPLDFLVDELKNRGSIKGHSLFDVVFSYMNFEHSAFEKVSQGPGIEIEPFNAEIKISSEYDLMIYGIETGDEIKISFKYRKAVWQENTIQKFADQYRSIVKSFTMKESTNPGNL